MSDVCDSFPKRLFTFSRAGDTDGISALLLAEERHASYSMPLAVDAVPCSGNGVTALHAAALNGHAAACDLLLSHRADPDIHDKWGDTAADRAYAAGHYVLGKTLRDRETRPGKVPWSWARHKFYPQEARRRVMALLETGDLPLHIRHRIASFLPLPMRQSEELAEACLRGDAERVRVLLEVENCDPEAEFKNRVPLHAAAEGHSAECIALLLHHGADPCAKRVVGRRKHWDPETAGEQPDFVPPPVNRAMFVYGESSLEEAKLLINAGADPNQRGLFDLPPLHCLSKYADLPTWKRALQMGVRVYEVSSYRDPLYIYTSFKADDRGRLARLLLQPDICQRCTCPELQGWLPCRCRMIGLDDSVRGLKPVSGANARSLEDLLD